MDATAIQARIRSNLRFDEKFQSTDKIISDMQDVDFCQAWDLPFTKPLVIYIRARRKIV